MSASHSRRQRRCDLCRPCPSYCRLHERIEHRHAILELLSAGYILGRAGHSDQLDAALESVRREHRWALQLGYRRGVRRAAWDAGDHKYVIRSWMQP